MENIKPWARSSVDGKSFSQTIDGAGKSLASVVALIAVVKGLDPTAATVMWESLVSQAVILVTAGVAAWNALQTIHGLWRKVLVFVGTN